MQGPSQSSGLGDEKQEFVKMIVKEFYNHPHFTTSEDFLVHLKLKYKNSPEYKPWIDKLVFNKSDDQYGIMTLSLENNPSDIEFRLKKENVYSGPKTENYLSRVDLRVDAAIELVNNNNALSSEERAEKIEYLNKVRHFFKDKINKDCYLDPKIMSGLKDNRSDALSYFNQKHDLAIKYLSVFNEEVANKVGHGDTKITKKALYNIEKKMMSDRKRPQRITARAIKLMGKKYYEINNSSPMTPQRTVSSAKKDEAGVANWLNSATAIYDDQFKFLDQREIYRSASIIPHDIMKKDALSKELAIDATRRNLLEHIIPALAVESLRKNPQQHPLVLNYEMLTLLSPINALADRLFDPDLGQFRAIRDAFERYQGRTFDIEIDGQKHQVMFNGIYHNYGVNPGRKLSSASKLTNQKAYNEILDRSLEALTERLKRTKGDQSDRQLYDLERMIVEIIEHPPFKPEQQQILNKYNEELKGKGGIYERMEANNAKLSKEEHATLMLLNAKRLNKDSLTENEKQLFDNLSEKFKTIKKENSVLQKEASIRESQIRIIHNDRASERQKYFLDKETKIENILDAYEAVGSEEGRKVVSHIRGLFEYTRLVVAGTDAMSRDQDKKNVRNYEIQGYIERLNSFCDWTFHETCKSGKDRTNAAIEKQKAKWMISLHEQRLVKGESERLDMKGHERTLFINGYQQGPGNDICGDNMKPGAQQVDKGDFSKDATAAIAAGKKVASLQKGIDHLEKVSEKDKLSILSRFNTQAFTQPASDTNPQVHQVKQVTLASHRQKPIDNSLHQQLTVPVKNLESIAQVGNDNIYQLAKRVKESSSEYETKMENLHRLQIIPSNNVTQSFYATSQSSSLSYSADKSQALTDERLKQICEFAVKFAQPGASIDLSIADPAIRSRLHSILTEVISAAGKADSIFIAKDSKPTISKKAES